MRQEIPVASFKYLVEFKFLICCRGRRILVKTTRKLVTGKNENGQALLSDFHELVKRPKGVLDQEVLFASDDTANIHQYLIKAFEQNFNDHKMEVLIYLTSNEKIDEFKYSDLMKMVLNRQVTAANKKRRKTLKII